MKKKIFSLILAICLILPCGFLMTACGKDKDLTNAEASKVCKDVALKTWSKIGISNPTASGVSYTSDSNSSDDKIEITISGNDENTLQFKLTANNMATVLYLMGMLYENTEFELTDGVIKFTATSLVGGDSHSYNFTLKPNLDTKNNKVYLEAYIEVGESGVQYVKIDADYDFDEGELKAFTVDYYTAVGMEIWTRVSLNKDGKAEIQQTQEGSKAFATEISANRTNFVNATKDIEMLNINLSATMQTYFSLTTRLAELIQNK